jgi:hypothetical protein
MNRAILLSILSVTACSSTQSATVATTQVVSTVPVVPPPPPPPPPAFVRVIHASPDSFAQTVVAFLDNGVEPAIPALQFRSGFGYLPIPPGTHTVQARLPGMAANTPPPVNWTMPDIQSGRPYTIIAHGLASDLSGPQITFAHEPDELAGSAPGQTRLRFFHALVGGGTVDVCIGGTTPAFAGVSYGTFGTAYGVPGHYAGSQAGDLRLTFRATPTRAGQPCGGRVVGSVPLTLGSGASVLLVATGRLQRGGGGVAPEVLVCIDTAPATASCTPLPVTPGR